MPSLLCKNSLGSSLQESRFIVPAIQKANSIESASCVMIYGFVKLEAESVSAMAALMPTVMSAAVPAFATRASAAAVLTVLSILATHHLIHHAHHHTHHLAHGISATGSLASILATGIDSAAVVSSGSQSALVKVKVKIHSKHTSLVGFLFSML